MKGWIKKETQAPRVLCITWLVSHACVPAKEELTNTMSKLSRGDERGLAWCAVSLLCSRDLFAGVCLFISGVVCHSRCVHSTSVRVCKLWTSVRHNLSTWCFDQRLCIQWYARAKPKSHGNHFGCHLRGKPLTLWLAGPQKLWTKATPIWRWKTTISPVNSTSRLDTWCGGEKVHSYTLTVFLHMSLWYKIKYN